MKENNIHEIHPLSGEYDLIAKVTVKSLEELGDIVFNKIRKIQGVTDTKILLVLVFSFTIHLVCVFLLPPRLLKVRLLLQKRLKQMLD